MTDELAAQVGGVPEPIVRTLRRLIRRARVVILVRGVGAVAAVAVLSLLAVMAVDAGLTLFSVTVRYGLTLTALALTLLAAGALLVRPLARSFTLNGIARAIEFHHPELQERISSAVELLSSDDAPEVRGSEALIGALVNEASGDVRTLVPRREITFRPARFFLAAALAATAFLAGLLLAWPRPAVRLLARAVAPYLNLANVAADDLTVEPGDTVITKGQSLRVDVRVANAAVRSAELLAGDPQRQETAQEMTGVFSADDEVRRFVFTCPPVTDSFRYRIHAGDALSRYYAVQVVPFPAVTRVDLRYEYPAYTRLAPAIEEDAAGDISAVAGTNVVVTAKTNTSVRSAKFVVNGEEAPGVSPGLSTAQDGTTVCTFSVRLTPKLAGRWRVEIADEHGFSNSPRELGITVLPDAPPTAVILHPEDRELRLRPTDQLPVLYAVGDDFGVGEAEFAAETEGGKLEPVPVPLAEEGRAAGPLAMGTAVLDLSRLPLGGVRQLTVRVRAKDNLPPQMGGPQEGLSEALTIELDREGIPYAEQVKVATEEEIRQDLEGALGELRTAKEQSTEVLPAVSGVGDLTQDAKGQLDQIAAHLDAAEGTVRELAQSVRWGTYAVLGPRLQALADDHIARAEDLAGQTKLTDDPYQRADLADETDLQTDLAIMTAEDLLRDFAGLAEAVRRHEDLEGLARRQAELAQARQSMEAAAPGQAQAAAPGQDQAAPVLTAEQWQQSQQQAAGEMAQMLAEGVRDVLAREGSPDLAEQARRLQQDQTALAEHTDGLRAFQDNEQALMQLARDQEALAQDTSAEESAADQKGLMMEAAQQIRSYDLTQAAVNQSAAGGNLSGRSTRLQQELAAVELTRQAEAAAGQQRELAQKAQQSKEQLEAAQAAAQAAETPEQKAGQEGAAEQAGQQLAALAEPQKALTDQVTSLQEQSRRNIWEVRQAFERFNPVGQMKEASGGMEARNAAGAAGAAGQAADMADKLVEQLKALQERFPAIPDKQQRSERLAALAARQQELERRTRDLANGRQQTLAQVEQGQLGWMQADQAEVAREAANLLRRTEELAPQPDRAELRAAQEAGRAARRIREPDVAAAAESAREAAENLSDVAQRLHDSAGRDPLAPNPGGQARLAEDTDQLARRQDRLAGEMEAFAQQDMSGAVVSRQGGLGERTADLSDQVERVREGVQQLMPSEAGYDQGRRALEELEKAGGAQHRAEDAVSEGRTREALPAQTESAQALGEAADALARMWAAYAPSAEQGGLWDLAAAQAPAQRSLSEAARAADEAARTLQAEAASRSAERMQAAAQEAAARLEELGLTPASMLGYMRVGRTLDPKRLGWTAADLRQLSAPELGEIQFTLDDWARLPGQLQDEILQAAGQDSPTEYRMLIKRYFRAIAKRGTGARDEGQR